jgi:hypothetical protein
MDCDGYGYEGATMHHAAVDFNTMNMDEEGRVTLPTHVNPELLTFLRPGLRIVAFTAFDIAVEAIVEYDTVSGTWLGRPEWSTLRSLQSDTHGRFWEMLAQLREVREAQGSRG